MTSNLSLPVLAEVQDLKSIFGFIEEFRRVARKNPELLRGIDPEMIAKTARILLSFLGNSPTDEERTIVLSGILQLKAVEQICKQHEVQVTGFGVKKEVLDTLRDYDFLRIQNFSDMLNYLKKERTSRWNQSRCKAFLQHISQNNILSQARNDSEKEEFFQTLFWSDGIRTITWDRDMLEDAIRMIENIGNKKSEKKHLKELFLSLLGVKANMKTVQQLSSWHLGKSDTPTRSGVASNLSELATKAGVVMMRI